MRPNVKSIILVYLMLALSLSIGMDSLNSEVNTPALVEIGEPINVLSSVTNLNEPGFQEGSIFSETTLSSGGFHTCAILDNGSVSCWGYNMFGQLGNGGTINQTTPTLTSNLGIGRTAVAVSSGGVHTCAILDNGSVSCWGSNMFGQLGNGGTTNQTTPTLTRSLGVGRTAIAISSGDAYTCVILDNGSVSCWGRGGNGQLGNGGISNKMTPTLTSSLGVNRTAVAISSGGYQTCAILDDGSVSCWGRNSWGMLGNGDSLDRTTPTLTSSLGENSTAVAISSGGSSTCAILDNGTVSCWGRGYYGGLGTGETSDSMTPTQTSSLGFGRTAVALSVGDECSCVILDNGSVSCWGYGINGRLGNGGTGVKLTPTLTNSLGANRTAVALSNSGAAPCTILDNGSISCWGRGTLGQLGNGGTSDSTTPTLISSLGTPTKPRNAALSERDFDADGVLNIFESTPPIFATCNAGQYGRFLCVDAPIGKYVPLDSAIYATDASPGYYVDQIGQSSQTPCLAGTYNPNTSSISSTDCVNADAGYYVGQTGQYMQTICPTGTYQANTGQENCDAASAGYYVEQIGQVSQIPCLAGTYNPNLGSTDSTDCGNADAGFYVDATGQSNQTACPAETYNPNIGSTTSADCVDTDAGFYVDATGQSDQSECGLGTYQPLTGQSFCDDADAGFYVDATGQSNQTACPAGTYNPSIGSTTSADCVDTDAGFYVDATGRSNQTKCGLGTYQSLTGQSFCDDADAGFYVDATGQSNQTACQQGTYNPNISSSDVSACEPCPDYTSTLSLGSENIAACKLDTDLDSIPDIVDPDDDNDGVVDELDAFPLDDSKFTDIANDKQVDNSTIQLTPEDKTDSNQSRVILVVIGIVSVILCGLVFMRQRKNYSEISEETPSSVNTSTNLIKESIEIQNPNPSPSIDQVGVIGGDGYEWINFPPNSQTNFYRAPGDKEWILWEN